MSEIFFPRNPHITRVVPSRYSPRMGNPARFPFLSSRRYHISLNATLKIYSVQEGDEGSYQCVAENDDDAGHSTGYLWLGGGGNLRSSTLLTPNCDC